MGTNSQTQRRGTQMKLSQIAENEYAGLEDADEFQDASFCWCGNAIPDGGIDTTYCYKCSVWLCYDCQSHAGGNNYVCQDCIADEDFARESNIKESDEYAGLEDADEFETDTEHWCDGCNQHRNFCDVCNQEWCDCTGGFPTTEADDVDDPDIRQCSMCGEWFCRSCGGIYGDHSDYKLCHPCAARNNLPIKESDEYTGLEDADEFEEEEEEVSGLHSLYDDCETCGWSGAERPLKECENCGDNFCGECGDLDTKRCKKCPKNEYAGLEDADEFEVLDNEEGLHTINALNRWVNVEVTQVPGPIIPGERSWTVEAQSAGPLGSTTLYLVDGDFNHPSESFKPFIGKLTLYHENGECTGYNWEGPEFENNEFFIQPILNIFQDIEF